LDHLVFERFVEDLIMSPEELHEESSLLQSYQTNLYYDGTTYPYAVVFFMFKAGEHKLAIQYLLEQRDQ
jgi:hypothetical protein